MSLILKLSQNYIQKESNGKKNFKIYHFLVKSKPDKRIDILITAAVDFYCTKKYSNSNENMLFLRMKLMK